MDFLRIDVALPCQNLSQASPSLADLSNLSFEPTISELNRMWGGRGSTSAEDEIDAAIARQRLAQAELRPETIVRGDDLKARLKALL